MLEPKRAGDDAFILEFKVFQPRKEQDLEETVASALAQIEEKGYAAELLERGIPAERIRRYGFAFCGKEVLIGGGKQIDSRRSKVNQEQQGKSGTE